MCVFDRRPRVAVIGTGMAGLACSWQLSQAGAIVTVYEKQAIPGLGAHSVEVDEHVVDMPPRIFIEDYYVNLLALFRHVKINMGPAEISQTFWHTGSANTYFRYFLMKWGKFALPLTLSPYRLLSPKFWRIVSSIYWFSRDIRRDLESGAIEGVTLGDYFASKNYSDDFKRNFFIPMFTTICTCSIKSLLAYPVKTIAEFVIAQPFLHSHKSFRAYGNGCQEVAQILLKDAHEVRCGVAVDSITNCSRSGNPIVTLSDGSSDEYDHVVLATQANHALTILPDATDEERRHLSEIKYEASDIVLHRDATLMPPTSKYWYSPMNIMVQADSGEGMCTAWQNAIQPPLYGKENLFQTWNPIVPVADDKVVSKATMQRSLVTLESEKMLETIKEIQGVRKLWFCGSYASRGIPLLESACTSGLWVAEAITGRKCVFKKARPERSIVSMESLSVTWPTMLGVGMGIALAAGVAMAVKRSP